MSDEQAGYPPLTRLASEMAEMEECTEQIIGSAEIIASIYANDEDEGLMILGRVRGALEVAAFWLMREESEAKGETKP